MMLLTNDGSHTLMSPQFGATYHSRFGAVTESAHVFIGAGFRYVSAGKQRIRLLETGLGTGLNALMTWVAAEQSDIRVAYTALELFPPSPGDVEALNYPDLLEGNPEDLRARLRDLHQAPWEVNAALSNHFSLMKKKTPIETFESEQAFDLVYFDAFAPETQPELWTEEVFRRMFGALVPGGVLVTYCAKGEVKRRMLRAGFQVERLPGPPGKREMTRGWRSGGEV